MINIIHFIRSKFFKSNSYHFIIGLTIFFAINFFEYPFQYRESANSMLSVAFLMAYFWITEILPLSITALIPLIAFPLLGISSTKTIAPIYVNSIIFLFLGGFLIAIAMEKWKLHRRIAFFIIRLFGKKVKFIFLGFMVATAFLSMWISNTATSIMMVSIAMGFVHSFKNDQNHSFSLPHNFIQALMLSIAYAASIGGIATLVGTPPNLSLVRIYSLSFPGAKEISFGQWIIFAFPLSLMLLLLCYLYITKFFHFNANQTIDTDKTGLEKLPPISYEEKIISIIFFITVFLWLFRSDLTIGPLIIKGYSNLLPYPKFVDDGTVAILMASLLFLLRDQSGNGLLVKDDIKKVPFNTMLLFGGGFALAKGFQISGLAQEIAGLFNSNLGNSSFILVAVITTVLTFLTELTSNTATTEMVLPLLASLSTAIKVPPLMLMIPATLAASCAFMLPAATPPNAIIFGTGEISIKTMAKVGIGLNIISIFLITIYCYFALSLIQ